MKRKPKLKEVFVRLEDHLECMCTSQHHVVEHSEAETGNSHPQLFIRAASKRRIFPHESEIVQECSSALCIVIAFLSFFVCFFVPPSL